jgi:hypothetical protein
MKKYRHKCLCYHLDHGQSPTACAEARRLAERSFLTGIRRTPNGIKERVERMNRGGW